MFLDSAEIGEAPFRIQTERVYTLCYEPYHASFSRSIYRKRVHNHVLLFILDHVRMRTIWRVRRIVGQLVYAGVYFTACLAFISVLHYVWCATKSDCTYRIFCPARRLILSSNTQLVEETQQSLCSARAGKRGPHQRVIGVSAYLSRIDNAKLMTTLKTYLMQYIDEARAQYPAWVVRVYYFSFNIAAKEIAQIEQNYPNVDFCDSTRLPILGNVLTWLPGKMHRFLPLVDPLVDVYMSRDIDSPILDRETNIVDLWLNSTHTIHIIRDHPEHVTPILGGLWGVKTRDERALIHNISQYLLSSDVVRCYAGKGDQTFLEDYIWPHAHNQVNRAVAYDSFLCKRFPQSVPFPTRKESPTSFVGCRRPNCTGDEHPECPKQCRPADHPDWIWC